MLVAVSISGIFLMSPVFADDEQTVRIPLGAVSPSCANDDSCYVPNKITINEGHKVEWINDDSTVHTATSGTPQDGHDGFFDSGVIMPRGEFEFTFNGFEVGTYPYYCTAHPWMVGSVTVVDYPVAGVSSDDDSRYDDRYDDDSRYDDSFEQYSHDKSIKSHTKSTLLDNQRMFGKYKVTVDWIRDLPAVNEINGIKILVSDTSKKGHGGCGGGSHSDKGSHSDSMKGMSGHEDKGKYGGHEGGCPHFKMVKRMIPQIELLENGVSHVDKSLKVTLSVGNNELTMPIVADENLPGKYTVVFVPTVAGYYGVELHGTIHGSPVNMMTKMDKVYDTNQIVRFP